MCKTTQVCQTCNKELPVTDFINSNRCKLKNCRPCINANTQRSLAKAQAVVDKRVARAAYNKQWTDIQAKPCTICGEIKPFSEFGKVYGKPSVLGYRSDCKSCKKIVVDKHIAKFGRPKNYTLESCRRYYNEGKEKLSDRHVKKLLKDIIKEYIPITMYEHTAISPELLMVKRAQVRLHKLIKTLS